MADASNEAKNTGNEPSERQLAIIRAFVRHPVAADVARSERSNERHVRRLVKEQFPDVVRRLRRDLDERETAEAKAARAEERGWAKTQLAGCRKRLITIIEEGPANASLSAIRMVNDMAGYDLARPDIGAVIDERLREILGEDGA